MDTGRNLRELCELRARLASARAESAWLAALSREIRVKAARLRAASAHLRTRHNGSRSGEAVPPATGGAA